MEIQAYIMLFKDYYLIRDECKKGPEPFEFCADEATAFSVFNLLKKKGD